MNPYQKIFASMTRQNPLHVETLAIMIHSTLDDLPRAAFSEVAALADDMGAKRLEQLHLQEVGAA